MSYDDPGESDTEPLPDIDPIRKWSIKIKEPIIDADKIKQIHIYDFDNTLFKSPIPNPNLWDEQTIKLLTRARYLNNSSWWQVPRLLEQCGSGYELEKANNWANMWVEDLVTEARKSISDPTILTILLTGRKRKYFQNIVSELVEAKGLDFDCIILKSGDMKNTSKFKIQVFTDFIKTYRSIELIRIYDDRPDQAFTFKKYFNSLRQHRFRYIIKVVKNRSSYLTPANEVNVVTFWVDSHNHNYTNDKVKQLGLLKVTKNAKYSIRPLDARVGDVL